MNCELNISEKLATLFSKVNDINGAEMSMEILYCNWQLKTKLNNVAYKITLAHYLLSLLVYYIEVKPQNKMRGFKGAWNRQSNEMCNYLP